MEEGKPHIIEVGENYHRNCLGFYCLGKGFFLTVENEYCVTLFFVVVNISLKKIQFSAFVIFMNLLTYS